MSPLVLPVSLAFASVLGYLGRTLKLWGILPLSIYAPQLDFLSAIVTSVGRGIPLSFSLCSNDVQGTYSDYAPLCQEGRAESEYFKDNSYPRRALLLPTRGLPSDPHFAKSIALT